MAKRDIEGKGPALLRVAQILQLIPVSRKTFERWVRNGDFPPGIKLSKRITVWRADVVYAWINHRHALIEAGQP